MTLAYAGVVREGMAGPMPPQPDDRLALVTDCTDLDKQDHCLLWTNQHSLLLSWSNPEATLTKRASAS